MTALVATILAMLTLTGPGGVPFYAYHLRTHADGPRARAEQLAEHLHDAAALARVDVALLTALAYHESTLDHSALSSLIAPGVRAQGLMQLNPRARWGKAWLAECRAARRIGQGDACEMLNARWGAWALRDALQACGSTVRALGFYRSGRCIAGTRSHATQRLAWQVRWRLNNPTTRPLTARLLP